MSRLKKTYENFFKKLFMHTHTPHLPATDVHTPNVGQRGRCAHHDYQIDE
ncbi:Hypothetical protein SMAX5B_016540 [Scophthalmus maximus]|uniref:Uncharacterized protein n=1 Tax=Scophthalmus maximus TaxID=52904 RepID=A0A2U9BSP2_SCOMX|nr:Hypothetical protein SMAX5B_016540 [Scophthalmus maximus]